MRTLVRIWCVPCYILNGQRLNGEHRELHVVFGALIKKRNGVKAGWQNHPQVLRFENHLGMLVDRHEQQVKEMERRGWNHKSPLIYDFEIPKEKYIYTMEESHRDIEILRERGVEI